MGIYTKEERNKICESWSRSGLGKTAYCKQYKISEYALRKWLKESNTISDAESTPIRFLQVNHNNTQASNFIEAILPNGITLKFDFSFSGIIKDLLQWK